MKDRSASRSAVMQVPGAPEAEGANWQINRKRVTAATPRTNRSSTAILAAAGDERGLAGNDNGEGS